MRRLTKLYLESISARRNSTLLFPITTKPVAENALVHKLSARVARTVYKAIRRGIPMPVKKKGLFGSMPLQLLEVGFQLRKMGVACPSRGRRLGEVLGFGKTDLRLGLSCAAELLSPNVHGSSRPLASSSVLEEGWKTAACFGGRRNRRLVAGELRVAGEGE